MLLLLACTFSETTADLSLPAHDQGLIYEIYVRSFQDSDGDGVGDFAGVESRLGYLEALGVETIWLMPVFPAYGPAGYDVTSFEALTEEYGSEDDLTRLVEAAHLRGMRVILDIPFNHVHRDHAWFGDYTGEHRSYFRVQDAPGEGSWHPADDGSFYYGYFGADMPDVDWENSEVSDAFAEIFSRWLIADGYRLDAVLMLVEEEGILEGSASSHAVVASLYQQVKNQRPDAYILTEASEWEVEKAVSWLGSTEAPESDAVLDFVRHNALIDAITTQNTHELTETLHYQQQTGALPGMTSFLSSHDLDRLPTLVPDPQARRMLHVAQFLLPGVPVLYYGEELDLPNASTATGQDYPMRAAMPWDTGLWAGFSTATPWFPPDPSYLDGTNVTDQSQNPESMLTLIQALSTLRKQYPLEEGEFQLLSTNSPTLLAFERQTPTHTLQVQLNFSDQPVSEPIVDGAKQSRMKAYDYRWTETVRGG